MRPGKMHRHCPRLSPKLVIPIDKGTYYDIPYMLEKLAGQLRNGEEGKPTDVIIGVRYRRPDGMFGVTGFHYGTGNEDVALSVSQRLTQKLAGGG